MIPKREGELKSLFTKEMKRRLPSAVMLLYASAGAPDRSITWNGYTTNWEFKHGTPQFESQGLQELTCMRLAVVGHCRYVIWQENDRDQKTLIVHPQKVYNRKGWDLETEAEVVFFGFDQVQLVEYIRGVHQIEFDAA